MVAFLLATVRLQHEIIKRYDIIDTMTHIDGINIDKDTVYNQSNSY